MQAPVLDSVLFPTFRLKQTRRFAVIEAVSPSDLPPRRPVYISLDCAYTRPIVEAAILRRPWCTLLSSLDTTGKHDPPLLQFSDFDNIEWEYVLSGRHGAASYLVRKGLSRKAQLSLQIRRYLSKNASSPLKGAVPKTLILETWNAHDEMRMDFGGGAIASFNLPPTPLRQRLEWCMEEVKAEMEEPLRADWLWILKPSVANKGVDISLVRTFSQVLDSLEDTPDMREWVLQKYVPSPLLLDGRKFHLRVYTLCVGSLQVHVFDRILILLAARSYSDSDLDLFRHLTNTAVAAEMDDFDEEQAVKLLEDLPFFSSSSSNGRSAQSVDIIKRQIHEITGELFKAFENEYTVFAPMPNCFELYGLDFLVDEDLRVHLLEVNPGPDFKQTGGRLRRVIVELWEQTCALVGLGGRAPDFTIVYDKETSTSKIAGGGLRLQD